ncbi:MAG TPA: ATP-dependent DNA ligase [Bryobacterales bacterium]|nr:ATP-dependent DNA ligase [Bryobacterales bacterium]
MRKTVREDVRVVAGREVPFTHPHKLLYPEQGITKARLADHYERVWPRMAPLLKDRPLTIKRYPRGLGQGGFYQRRVQEWFPDWVRSTELPMKDDPSQVVREVVADHPATLVFLVNIGALEIHASLARAQAPDLADMMIFDLDPPGDFTDEVRRVAVEFRDMLEDLGLPVYVKTTGSRGFHVTVPLKPRLSFDVTRRLARALGERMIARDPDNLTLMPRKDVRKGRILIDIWRNAYAQTAVAPWSTRARAGATVATPLSWDEMTQGIHPRAWTIANIGERLALPDPWADFFDRALDLRSWARSAPDDLAAIVGQNVQAG